MIPAPSPAATAHAALAVAVDAIGRLDLTELAPGEAPTLLAELCTLSDRLGGEIARTAAAVSESGEWAASGACSIAAHISNATGMAIGRARAAVELGEAMAAHAPLDTSVRSGALSPAAAAKLVPALGDEGCAEVVDALVGELSGMTPTQAERHVEAWRAVANADDDHARRAKAHDARSLTIRPVGDGMSHIEGVVPNEVAQGLRRTLKHLADQQRLDGSERTHAQRRVDAIGDLVNAYERGEVTGGRNIPRLIVTSTLENLERRAGVAVNAQGELVTATELDQLCCDAQVHRYITDQSGAVLDFGRGRRTASPQQFLALLARDRGCRHPGCDRPPQWCEAHHLREFAARGGLTNLDELVLLCHHHHHALHDARWVLSGTADHLVFTGPAGRQLHSTLATPSQPELPTPVPKNAA